MDSVTQLTLGAAVGVAILGRRTAIWKAALWGGVCGTLPDLDAFIDYGDPVRNMTLHRTWTHALAVQTVAAPFVAGVIALLQRDGLYRRWWLMVWLVFVTHALLDWMTVYGTQLGLPFTDTPFGVGSIFIIDPLYTLPLLIGLGIAVVRDPTSRHRSGLRWNAAGLLLSTAYLGWSVLAQQHVRTIALDSLARAGISHDRLLVTPAPLNTVLWRIVAMTPDGYVEGYRSLLDDDRPIDFIAWPSDRAAFERHADDWSLARIAWFSRGFYSVSAGEASGSHGTIRIRDLRMGQEPNYVFSFDVPVTPRPDDAPRPPAALPAWRAAPPLPAAGTRPVQTGSLPGFEGGLPALWRRLLGDRNAIRPHRPPPQPTPYQPAPQRPDP